MDADNKKPVDAEKEPAAKGINWLTIFGWAVLAILVVIIIFVLAKYKQAQDNPLVQAATRMEPYITEMKEKTRSQIEEMSQPVYASDYEAIAEPMTAYMPYADAYVMVEGEISKDVTQNVAANVAGNVMSTSENYGAYVLNDNLVVIDIETGYQDLAEGTTINACGRLLIVRIDDIWDLPIIGPDLKTEFEGIEGMPEGVVFLISKEIRVLDEPTSGLAGGDAPAVEPEIVEGDGDVEDPGMLFGPEPEDGEEADDDDAGEDDEEAGDDDEVDDADEGEGH